MRGNIKRWENNVRFPKDKKGLYRLNIPESGVYGFYFEKNICLYVGSSKYLTKRISKYLENSNECHNNELHAFIKFICKYGRRKLRICLEEVKPKYCRMRESTIIMFEKPLFNKANIIK